LKVYKEVKLEFQPILISILNRSGHLHDQAAVSPVEKTLSTQRAEGWLSFRAGLDAYEKKISTCDLSFVQLRAQSLYQLHYHDFLQAKSRQNLALAFCNNIAIFAP
jgi:hypothetical protein